MLELDLWLAVDALAAIEATAEAKYPFETGGVLVGYRSGASQIIESAIGPGPNAIHARYSFHSDHEWQCDKLDELFLQSKGRQVYLGEWHTHPGGDCRMSMVDRRTLAKNKASKCPRCVYGDRSGAAGCMVVDGTSFWVPAHVRRFFKVALNEYEAVQGDSGTRVGAYLERRRLFSRNATTSAITSEVRSLQTPFRFEHYASTVRTGESYRATRPRDVRLFERILCGICASPPGAGVANNSVTSISKPAAKVWSTVNVGLASPDSIRLRYVRNMPQLSASSSWVI